MGQGRTNAAVLALHWQVNVIKPEGFFGGLLAEPVARSGVVERAAQFHEAVLELGLPLLFTRFIVPEGGGALVRNTPLMSAVAQAQAAFRPDAPGTRLIPEMAAQAKPDHVFDNQKLSGLAGNDVLEWLRAQEIDTVFITGVATNLTVEQTARHGSDCGLIIHPVADCTAASTDEAHAAALANLDLVTAGCLTAAQALSLAQ
jgi:biuret amidohydrolase